MKKKIFPDHILSLFEPERAQKSLNMFFCAQPFFFSKNKLNVQTKVAYKFLVFYPSIWSNMRPKTGIFGKNKFLTIFGHLELHRLASENLERYSEKFWKIFFTIGRSNSIEVAIEPEFGNVSDIGYPPDNIIFILFIH